MENKFSKAQNYFLFNFVASVIATFVALYYIPSSGTGIFSHIVGFAFALSATMITQFFFLDVLLDNRARNVPVARDEWVSALFFYIISLGIAGCFVLIRFIIKDFAWGFAIGTASGVVVPTFITIMAVGGVPWVERKKKIIST